MDFRIVEVDSDSKNIEMDFRTLDSDSDLKNMDLVD